MNKHEEIRITILECVPKAIRDELLKYSEESEATEKRLEELERDVKRFIEIFNISDNSKLWNEHNELVAKLSKVGETK